MTNSSNNQWRLTFCSTRRSTSWMTIKSCRLLRCVQRVATRRLTHRSQAKCRKTWKTLTRQVRQRPRLSRSKQASWAKEGNQLQPSKASLQIGTAKSQAHTHHENLLLQSDIFDCGNRNALWYMHLYFFADHLSTQITKKHVLFIWASEHCLQHIISFVI